MKLAASMKLGEWAELKTTDFEKLPQVKNGSMFFYSDEAIWHPGTHAVLSHMPMTSSRSIRERELTTSVVTDDRTFPRFRLDPVSGRHLVFSRVGKFDEKYDLKTDTWTK